MEMDKDTHIEHLKDVAQRRRLNISTLNDRIAELESELEDMSDIVDEHRSDASFWRDMADSFEERWQDKTELLKRIGELS